MMFIRILLTLLLLITIQFNVCSSFTSHPPLSTTSRLSTTMELKSSSTLLLMSSSPSPSSSSSSSSSTTSIMNEQEQQEEQQSRNNNNSNGNNNNSGGGGILILDHININHEKGKHNWLKSFYYDFLQMSIDPRKEENLQKGKKTLWANIGSNQFHLPEGKPNAQILDGIITLSYKNLSTNIMTKDNIDLAYKELDGSKFNIEKIIENNNDNEESLSYKVIDPWGNIFILIEGTEEIDRDVRGQQIGCNEMSNGLCMKELTIYTSHKCNINGIGRFYNEIFDTSIIEQSNNHCVVSVGPNQKLIFQKHPTNKNFIHQHDDLRDENNNNEKEEEDKASTEYSSSKKYLSNYGPHISIYVSKFSKCYNECDKLGITYVNPRFKRRAYTLNEALDQCMFRIIDIIDPKNPNDGTIIKLEHEVRSVIKNDGSKTKYKSCPFNDIPECCFN